PECIALLRLDTDWYESTRHEMIHLFPRLCVGGVLILDDYGHWLGARRAVDEYLGEHNVPLFLQRIDYTGRYAVKWR
ncbi:MAG TPA: TylF/MycF/NovP-related O-methyltransferase, partial [Pseudoxanthomonas sp.]|nr:TylF/MycF/NovP-related O-methyltransferase [Pseudoxanthomonas sp.]